MNKNEVEVFVYAVASEDLKGSLGQLATRAIGDAMDEVGNCRITGPAETEFLKDGSVMQRWRLVKHA